MPGDFKEELSVAASVGQLTFGRRAKWKAAKEERPGVVSEFLLVMITLLSDELDDLQVFKPAFGEADGGQHGLERGERGESGGGRRWSPAVAKTPRAVPKLCQKCMELRAKGFHF